MSRTIEFETELRGGSALDVPADIASSLPSSGKATVVVYIDMDPDDAAWRADAYKQFLADDSQEDASYDRYL